MRCQTKAASGQKKMPHCHPRSESRYTVPYSHVKRCHGQKNIHGQKKTVHGQNKKVPSTSPKLNAFLQLPQPNRIMEFLFFFWEASQRGSIGPPAWPAFLTVPPKSLMTVFTAASSGAVVQVRELTSTLRGKHFVIMLLTAF